MKRYYKAEGKARTYTRSTENHEYVTAILSEHDGEEYVIGFSGKPNPPIPGWAQGTRRIVPATEITVTEFNQISKKNRAEWDAAHAQPKVTEPEHKTDRMVEVAMEMATTPTPMQKKAETPIEKTTPRFPKGTKVQWHDGRKRRKGIVLKAYWRTDHYQYTVVYGKLSKKYRRNEEDLKKAR